MPSIIKKGPTTEIPAELRQYYSRQPREDSPSYYFSVDGDHLVQTGPDEANLTVHLAEPIKWQGEPRVYRGIYNDIPIVFKVRTSNINHAQRDATIRELLQDSEEEDFPQYILPVLAHGPFKNTLLDKGYFVIDPLCSCDLHKYMCNLYTHTCNLSQKENFNPTVELAYLFKLMNQVAQTLDYLHMRKEIVHRDVTPGNILIDFAGNAVLTDFALAHNIGKLVVSDGHPSFCAPENRRATRHRLSHTEDIAMFAKVIASLISGQYPAPFSKSRIQPTRIATAFWGLNIAQINELNDLISKARDKEIGNRPNSARQLLEDVQGICLG